MGMPKTIRLEKDLEKKVEVYLEANGIKFAQLVNIAVERFISEPQTIELKPVDSKEFMKIASNAFKKHKAAMDKLK